MIGLCLLMPACISMTIQTRRNRNRVFAQGVLGELFEYGIWVLAINFLAMLYINYFLGIKEVLEEAFHSFQFAIKYLAIAGFIAIVTPYVVEVFGKYISVTFCVGGKDEKEK